MNKYYQKGISPIGVLIYVCFFALCVTFGLKCAPHYMEYNSLKTIFNDVANLPDIRDMPASKIKTAIEKSLSINSIREFNVNESMYMDKSDGYVIGFQYEVREHLIANIDLVLAFEHEVEIK